MRTHFTTPCLTALAAAILALAPVAGAAQDANIMFPIDTIESKLRTADFEIVDMRASRGLEGERTYRTTLSFDDGTMMLVKWAPAPRGGEEFNNTPRYEVAAYAIQSLFLAPGEFVVPPTVLRAFPLDWYRTTVDKDARPTFRNSEDVLVVLQYWLFNVTPDDFWDEDRFAADTTYARNFANFNILTYLIRHNDENEGNYLISTASGNPRVFSVDNGVAFESEASDRGYHWRRMRVDRLPARTVTRLHGLTEDDLTQRLATLAQFRVGPDGALTREPPGEPIDPNKGVREKDGVIQFGLTSWEIRQVWNRVQSLLKNIADGDYQIF